MKSVNGLFIIGILCLLSVAINSGGAVAADDFPKRSISVIVPYSPGGGFDTQARGIAPFIEKYLPGKANVIIKNMPGAGGLVATHHVWNSKPDGYKILQCVVAPALVEQYLNPKEISFRLAEFEWVGQYQKDIRAVGVQPKLPINNWNDLVAFGKKRPILLGTPGLGSPPYKESRLISKIAGIPIDLVNYPGSKDCQAGMARGEIEAINLNFNSLMQWGEDCRIIFIWDDQRHALLPNVPTALEAGVPRGVYDGIMDPPVMGTPRAFAVPPGTPAEVVNILRKAFMQAMNDPEYKAWIQKAKQIYGPIVSGEDFNNVIKRMNASMQKNLELIKSLGD